MIELDVQARRSRSESPDEEPAFRILVMGNFGAETPRPVLVDRDNIDTVIGKLGVGADLPLAGAVRFRRLDEFHPDSLYARLPMFQALRETRRKLEDPDTYRETAAQFAAPPREPAKPDVAAILSASSLLDDIVEATGKAAQGRPPADAFETYLQRLVAPYGAPKPDPKQKELLAQVDAAVNGQMRALLHAPEFQTLEAAWRSVAALVRSIDSGVRVKIYILHLPFEKLRVEMLAANDLKQTLLYDTLVRHTAAAGAPPWSLVAGNYSFSAAAEDVEVLARIALLCAAADAPFVAAADPDVERWKAPPAYWDELRSIPEAAYVGLALPRLLLRLPYGAKTHSADTFDFEEMPHGPKHNEYLWGNGAFACIQLLIEAFAEEGWAMEPSQQLFLHGLPLHVYKLNGESVSTPVAELSLGEDDVERLIDRGLMPLVSYRDHPVARLTGFRAVNGSALGKRW